MAKDRANDPRRVPQGVADASNNWTPNKVSPSDSGAWLNEGFKCQNCGGKISGEPQVVKIKKPTSAALRVARTLGIGKDEKGFQQGAQTFHKDTKDCTGGSC